MHRSASERKLTQLPQRAPQVVGLDPVAELRRAQLGDGVADLPIELLQLIAVHLAFAGQVVGDVAGKARDVDRRCRLCRRFLVLSG